MGQYPRQKKKRNKEKRLTLSSFPLKLFAYFLSYLEIKAKKLSRKQLKIKQNFKQPQRAQQRQMRYQTFQEIRALKNTRNHHLGSQRDTTQAGANYRQIGFFVFFFFSVKNEQHTKEEEKKKPHIRNRPMDGIIRDFKIVININNKIDDNKQYFTENWNL